MSEFDAFAQEVAQEETTRKRQLSEATSLGAATTFEPAGQGALPDLPKTAAPASEFDGFAEDLAAEENGKVSRGLELAAQHDPEAYAKARAIADRDGLPVDFALSNLPELQKRETVSRMRAALESNPGLREWFKQGDNGAVVKLDELDRLAGLPWLMGAAGAKFSEGQRQVRLGEIGAAILAGKASPEMIAEGQQLDAAAPREFDTGGFLTGAVPSFAEMLPSTLASFGAGFKGGVTGGTVGATIGGVSGAAAGGVGAIPGAAAGWGAGFLAGSRPGAALKAYELEAGGAYWEFSKFRDENGNPLDPSAVKVAAVIAGTVNAGLEMFGLETMAKQIPGLGKGASLFGREAIKEALKRPQFRDMFTNFAKGVGETVGAEVGTELLQEFVTMFAGEMAKQSSDGNFTPLTADEWGTRLLDTATQTAQAMLVMGPLLGSSRVAGDYAAAKRSEKTVEFFKALDENVADNGLRERNPKAFKEAFEAATADTAKTMYVPVGQLNELFQSYNVSPADLQDFVGFGDSYRDAMLTGGDVEIRLSDYATKLAATPFGDAMRPHVRLSPEDMTDAEAKAFNEAWQDTRLKLMEEDVARLKDEAARSAPAEAVFQDVRDKAVAAGRSLDVAEQYATVWQAFFSTLAEKTGGDALQLYQDRGVEIRFAFPEQLSYQSTDDLDLLLDDLRAGREVAIDREKRKALGPSLSTFLRSKGGLQDSGGELRARDVGGTLKAKEGKGLNLDDAALAAWEAGYFPDFAETRPSIDDLLSALDNELSGSPVYKGGLTPDAVDLSTEYLGRLETMGRTLDELGLSVQSLSNEAIRQELEAITNQDAEQGALFQPGSEAFKAWFGNSKVVDAEGNPLVVYHGSPSAGVIQSFKRRFGGGVSGWFAENKALSEGYARKPGSGIIEAYLHIENPLDLRGLDMKSQVTLDEVLAHAGVTLDEEVIERRLDGTPRDKKYTAWQWLNGDDGTIIGALERLGYDGIVQEEGSGERSTVTWATFRPEQIKAANNTGSFDPNDSRIYYQFAGVQGAVRLDGEQVPALQEAARMQAEGAYPDEIFEATGWFQGVDGAWRFEIADTDATINEKELRGSLKFKDGKAVNGKSFGGKLSDLLSHPNLFNAYPQLADMRVEALIEPGGSGGAFHPDAKKIVAKGSDTAKMRSVLLHEVAHAIQEMEGFAPGGNLGMGEIYEGEAVARLQEEVQRLQQQSALAPADELLTVKQKLARAAQYEYYRRIAGEVEARNVQTRDQERQTGQEPDIPWYTQDVPNDQQIIIARTETHGESMQSVGAPRREFDVEDSTVDGAVSGGQVERLPARSYTVQGSEDFITVVTNPDGTRTVRDIEVFSGKGHGTGQALYLRALEDGPLREVPELRSDEATRTTEAMIRKGLVERYEEGGASFLRLASREYFQKAGSDLGGPRADKRGSIQFGTGRTIINLFEKADLSTFLHESGHFFLEVTRDMALREGAPQALVDDWQAIKGWLGLTDDTVTVDAHEQFARGFEAYLFDGKAPSEALQGAFARFRAWLTFIYRKISRLNVNVTPEIKAVFDRMLATEEEIAAASDVYRSIAKTAEEAKQFGVDEAWYAKQQDLARQANEQAISDLQARMLRDVKRETTREWNENKKAVREEVLTEFSRMPVYQVTHYLRTGQAISDEVTVPGGRMALDRAYLVDRYGDSILTRLPRSVPPIYADAAKSTRKDVAVVHPDILAEAFGYESGDALVQDLLSAPPYARALTEEVNLRMRDRFGDLLTEQDRRMDEAVAAVHNDRRAEFLENEMKALYRASQRVLQGHANAEGAGFRLGASLPSRQVAARMARDIIAGKKVADATRVGFYARQESKAGREAEKAIAAGDYKAAAEHKRRQLFAHYLALEARRAKEEVESATRYLNRFGNRKRPAAVDPDYLDQIEGLLERYDLRPGTSLRTIEKRKRLAEFIAEKEAAGEAIAIPQHLRDESQLVSYKDLTVDDLRAVVDSVKNLEHLGKLKNKLLVGRKALEFQNVKDELTASAQANVDARKKIQGFNPNKWEKLNLQILSAAATMARIEQVIEWLDGGDINGPWRRFLWAPMAEAAAKEAALREKVMGPILAVWDGFPKGYLAENHYFKSFDRNLKKSEIFALALNTGTESNLQRLLAGEKLREGGGVDTQAKLNEVLAVLTKQDWDAIQTIWDQINSLWPDASALEKRLTGLEPVKVEAREVETPHGTYKGGYYPLVYDNAQAVDVSARLMSKEDLKMDPQFARIGREAGYLKTRVEEYGEPLSTNLDVITRHIEKVVHDITHWEAVKETNKLVMDPEVATVIRDHLGAPFHDEFKKWLKRIWHGDDLGDVNGFQRVLGKLRSNAGVYALAYRWTTIVTQFAGFGPSAARVGARPLASAMKQYWMAGPSNPLEGGHRNAVEEFVFAKSSEMRNRANSINRDIRLGLAKLEGKDGTLAEMQRFGFMGIAMADRWVSVPTWLAGYNAHIEQFPGDEAGAVEAGDRAVRLSQGAGGTKDVSSLQVDPNFQLLTMFYGPFNVLFNNLWSLGRDFRSAFRNRSVEEARSVVWRGLLFVVIPAVMADLMTGRGPDDDDKEKKGAAAAYAAWLAKKIALYPMGTIPLLRDAASYLDNGFESNPNPASRMLNAGAKVVMETTKGRDANPRVIAKNAADAAGMAMGLPIGAGVTAGNNVARHAQEGDLRWTDFLFSRR